MLRVHLTNVGTPRHLQNDLFMITKHDVYCLASYHRPHNLHNTKSVADMFQRQRRQESIAENCSCSHAKFKVRPNISNCWKQFALWHQCQFAWYKCVVTLQIIWIIISFCRRWLLSNQKKPQRVINLYDVLLYLNIELDQFVNETKTWRTFHN